MNTEDRKRFDDMFAEMKGFHGKHEERSVTIQKDLTNIKEFLCALECQKNKNDINWLKKIIWLPVSSVVIAVIGFVFWGFQQLVLWAKK